MSVNLYMYVHVRSAITAGLRQRGVDVLTAQEDRTATLSDPKLLDRATKLGRAQFSQDKDLLAEAKRRQVAGREFAGVIYGHQLKVTVRQCIEDLELISQASDPGRLANRVEYLPQK